ncbi:MAG: PEP-CTERM sorting domain-containing protein [Xenococcaceae cyanobacterium]
MKSKISGIGVAVPLIAVGTIVSTEPAGAITLNTGDSLDLAGTVTIVQDPDDFIFTFSDPAGCTVGDSNCEFVVTDATGGFSVFAGNPTADTSLNPNASYQFPFADNTINLNNFSASEEEAPGDPTTNFLADEMLNPTGTNKTLVPSGGTFDLATLELGESAVDPDLLIQITEVTSVNTAVTAGDAATLVFSAVQYVTEDGTVLGSGRLSTQFNVDDPTTSVSLDFEAVEDDPEAIPEPGTIFGSAIALGLGLLNLSKKSRKAMKA